MSNVANPVRKSKVSRSVRVELPADADGDPCVISITVGKLTVEYFVYPIASDWGRAFRLDKLANPDEQYHVNLDGEQSSCECLGWLRHGHCKHRDGLQVLVDKGLLPAAPTSP